MPIGGAAQPGMRRAPRRDEGFDIGSGEEARQFDADQVTVRFGFDVDESAHATLIECVADRRAAGKLKFDLDQRPSSAFCRRRWTELPMPIASRYLATVRRAMSKPLALS